MYICLFTDLIRTPPQTWKTNEFVTIPNLSSLSNTKEATTSKTHPRMPTNYRVLVVALPTFVNIGRLTHDFSQT